MHWSTALSDEEIGSKTDSFCYSFDKNFKIHRSHSRCWWGLLSNTAQISQFLEELTYKFIMWTVTGVKRRRFLFCSGAALAFSPAFLTLSSRPLVCHCLLIIFTQAYPDSFYYKNSSWFIKILVALLCYTNRKQCGFRSIKQENAVLCG